MRIDLRIYKSITTLRGQGESGRNCIDSAHYHHKVYWIMRGGSKQTRTNGFIQVSFGLRGSSSRSKQVVQSQLLLRLYALNLLLN